MNKTTFFAAFAALFLTMGNPVSAAEKTSLLLQASPARTVAFAFHKITNTAPDFDRGIRSLRSFRDANQTGQAAVLATERAKYQVEFASLDARKSVLIARSAVTLKADLSGRSLKVSLADAPLGSLYFPYVWADRNYALIPNQFDVFLNIPLSMNEISAASSKIGAGGAATMVVEMLPISADGTKPMMLDNVPQWLLMTKVVAVTFYNGYLETIWSWQSPDFKRPGYAPIQGLKK